MTTTMTRAVTQIGGCVLSAAIVLAQPDPRQMSGLPLPDPQLPTGTITVRVVRGALTDNVAGHPVELRQGDNVVTVNTDAEGRAEFLTLNPGATVVAATRLDGVELESQPFPVPGRGGIRLMLVGAPAGGDVADVEPAEAGTVMFGADSRIVIELGEETVSVFYLLDVVNPRDVPVEPDGPLELTMPFGAVSTTVLAESDPRARGDGTRVTIPGPFAPGATPLRIGYVLPYSGDSVSITQELPVDLGALLLIVEKWGQMDLASTQIARRADMTPDGADGGTYIFAAGPPIAAGTALSFEISGLPHHSRLAGTLTVVVGLLLLGAGAWGAAVPSDSTDRVERRRRLERRRDKRFAELVRLEQQHDAGKIAATKYAHRRQELLTQLERVYRELDEELTPVVLSSTRSASETAPATGQSGTTG